MKQSQTVYENHYSEAETLRDQFAEDILNGLSLPRKKLPCKYIYDNVGTELFSRIMTLREYYPARCEAEILETHGKFLAEKFKEGPVNLVELGAGDGRKTRILIEDLINAGSTFTYVPLDISRAAVHKCSDQLCLAFPELRVKGMVSDYFDGLKWLSQQDQSKNMALFLGSTIGNFSPRDRRKFLDKLRRSLNPGDMVLIGFDLVKDIDVMVRAYNDSQGITAQFNKNILARINRELGGTFKLDGFRYFSTWDAISGGIQSFLISKKSQKAHIESLSKTFEFESWEAIHTESSHKFTLPQIRKLASESGFAIADQYLDSRHYFADCLWQVV